MRKTLSIMVIAIGLGSSISALAATSTFHCPDPNNSAQLKYSDNMAVLYAPRDSISGMPDELQGNNGTGIDAAFSGLTFSLNHVYTPPKTTFGGITVPSPNVVYCVYNIQAIDDKGQQINNASYLTFGGKASLNYTYSLSGSGRDISTYIIANGPN
jgi:hypothetical protein